ncbi:MAG: hypothetical protein ACYC4Q_07225, partial [Victivallaceae bacterium]
CMQQFTGYSFSLFFLIILTTNIAVRLRTRPIKTLIIRGRDERSSTHVRHDKKVIVPQTAEDISSISAALHTIIIANEIKNTSK